MNYTTKSMHDYLSHEIQQAEAKINEVLDRAYEIKQQYDATLAELPSGAAYKLKELMR